MTKLLAANKSALYERLCTHRGTKVGGGGVGEGTREEKGCKAALQNRMMQMLPKMMKLVIIQKIPDGNKFLAFLLFPVSPCKISTHAWKTFSVQLLILLRNKHMPSAAIPRPSVLSWLYSITTCHHHTDQLSHRYHTVTRNIYRLSVRRATYPVQRILLPLDFFHATLLLSTTPHVEQKTTN